MDEGTSGALLLEGGTGNPAAELKVCTGCGRGTRRVRHEKCDTCYMRAYRAGEIPKRDPLDPEVAALLLPVPRTSATFAERVFSYIDFSGDCWEWTGTKDDGYGVIGRGGRGTGTMPAHCAVWSLLVGAIPDGMHYDHLCRNHGCVFPGHGEIVTPEENKRRGYGIAVLYAKRTVCNFGHPLDGRRRDSKSGKIIRYCKTCAREKSLKRYYDLKAARPPQSPQTGEEAPWSA